MKRIIPVLFALLYLFSGFGAWAKGGSGVKPARVKNICRATTDPKRDDSKIVSKTRSTCQAGQQSRKAKELHAYKGPIEFLAALFPVLFNFTRPDEPACASVVSKQRSYYTHAPPVKGPIAV